MYPFINHNQNDVISKMLWKNLHTLFYTLLFLPTLINTQLVIPELSSKIEDAGLDVTYESRWKQYRVKLGGFDDYKKHEELIKECVEAAMEYFNISEM